MLQHSRPETTGLTRKDKRSPRHRHNDSYQTPAKISLPLTLESSPENSFTYGGPVHAYYPFPSHVETYTSFVPSPVHAMGGQVPSYATFVPPTGFVSMANLQDPSWIQMQDSSRGNLSPSFVNYPPPPICHGDEEPEGIRAVVEEAGFISLHLEHGMTVKVAPNQAVLLSNSQHETKLSISGCGTQMALLHPQGRVLQYNSRIEVQAQRDRSIKNAKIWPRGISFTSNHRALVYLVDQAGARSTTDTFHNLYADDIAQVVFERSYSSDLDGEQSRVERSVRDLERAGFWKTKNDVNCWNINNVIISQTNDGLVSIERQLGSEVFHLTSSPNNGKARLQSSFVYITASVGPEAHIFVKSNERRLHHNGEVFVVRNAGHSAGFDEKGLLKIW